METITKADLTGIKVFSKLLTTHKETGVTADDVWAELKKTELPETDIAKQCRKLFIKFKKELYIAKCGKSQMSVRTSQENPLWQVLRGYNEK